MPTLQDKVVIVTGSSSGIGAEIAREFASQGATVVVNSRSSVDEGSALAESLVGAIYVQGDISDEDQANRIVEATLDRFGHVDILVNNAATTKLVRHSNLAAITSELWHEILDVNVIGTWNMIRASVPALKATRDGCIINISSLAGMRTLGSSIPYSVSKAAVNHMTLLLANVLGPEVRVNAVAPGLILTPWTEGWQKAHDMAAEGVPLGRSGEPSDVAGACTWLAKARYTTGEVVVVDGGLHLRDLPLR